MLTKEIRRTVKLSFQEPLRLRAAHISEAAEIASISRQQVEYGLKWRWTPARVKCHIKDKKATVLVASVAGVMQGFAIMKFQNETAHLLLLAVQPKLRRSGVGSSTLKYLEESCIEAGIQRIRLEVRASNQTARRFYDQHGYKLLEKIEAYYDKRETAIVMGKTFNNTIVD